MTRKRFVKLCMANGYSRNSANRIAEGVRAKGRTYAEGAAAVRALKKLEVSLSPALAETIERATKAINKMAKAVSAGVAAFSKAYRSAMDAMEEERQV